MICLAFYEPVKKNKKKTKDRKPLKSSLFVSRSRETNTVMSGNQTCVKNSLFKPAINLTARLNRLSFSPGAVWENEAWAEPRAGAAPTLALV